ncbi:hypothetical protein RB195_013489 [Necator americanus]|uniref:Uncharacterized protein n=1 Tax=Necator americanus TaxID=51031 RepID=A0ABR1DX86_NECAM
MEVEAEAQPKVRHPKPEKQDADLPLAISATEPETAAPSYRPGNTIHDRRTKIPLHVQFMMASGPVNGREMAYYPWEDGNANQQKKGDQQVKEDGRPKQKSKGNEAIGVVAL